MIWNPPWREIICRLRCFWMMLGEDGGGGDFSLGFSLPHSLSLTLIRSPLQTNADLLIENFENILRSASLEQVAVHLETRYRLSATPCGPQVHVNSFHRVVLSGTRPGGDDVLDLVHEDLYPSIETRGDGLVEDVLEPLLLADNAVEEVGAVDVWDL